MGYPLTCACPRWAYMMYISPTAITLWHMYLTHVLCSRYTDVFNTWHYSSKTFCFLDIYCVSRLFFHIHFFLLTPIYGSECSLAPSQRTWVTTDWQTQDKWNRDKQWLWDPWIWWTLLTAYCLSPWAHFFISLNLLFSTDKVQEHCIYLPWEIMIKWDPERSKPAQQCLSHCRPLPILSPSLFFHGQTPSLLRGLMIGDRGGSLQAFRTPSLRHDLGLPIGAHFRAAQLLLAPSVAFCCDSAASFTTLSPSGVLSSQVTTGTLLLTAILTTATGRVHS